MNELAVTPWGPPRTPMVTAVANAHHRRPEGRYSTLDISRLTGATYRQLDYWARVGYIPGQPAGSTLGSGIPRRWTDEQLHRVRILRIASILRHGTLPQVIAWLENFDVLDDVERAVTWLDSGAGELVEGNTASLPSPPLGGSAA